jgi:hypothetical protein
MPNYRPKTMSHERYFWTILAPDLSNEHCWLWPKGQDKNGYGRFVAKSLHPTETKAHRFAWILAHGPIPMHYAVLHRCDTPACCRPSHLFLGTIADNTHDMMRKGRKPDTASKGTAWGKAMRHGREIFTECSQCGATHLRHKSQGLCDTCYTRKRRLARRQ